MRCKMQVRRPDQSTFSLITDLVTYQNRMIHPHCQLPAVGSQHHRRPHSPSPNRSRTSIQSQFPLRPTLVLLVWRRKKTMKRMIPAICSHWCHTMPKWSILQSYSHLLSKSDWHLFCNSSWGSRGGNDSCFEVGVGYIGHVFGRLNLKIDEWHQRV